MIKKATKKEDRTFREAEKKYTVGKKTFTEKDFKNPPPIERETIEYKIAYGEWAEDNGLTIKFKNTEDAIKWFDKI